MLYARKISEDGWFYKDDNLDADSISELNVKGHGLSVWKVLNASNKIDVDKIGLALAMINPKVEEFYMVLIDPANLASDYKWAIAFIPQPGATRYSNMKDEHTNFEVKSMWELGFLTEHIHKLIQDEKNYRYYNVSDLKKMAYDAAKNGNLTKKDVDGCQWKTAIKEMEKMYGELTEFWK
jgi:hypothetical protein